jgi:flagellar protein FlbD
MIEYMESTPDTVITLTNGHKYVVLETLDEVIDKVIHYKRHIYMGTDFEDR